MDKENLNVRAAKALGWTHFNDHPTTQWMIPSDFAREHQHTPTSYDSDLQFTTSYDWAMWGVKACDKPDLLFDWRCKLDDLMKLDGEFLEDRSHAWLATPEQITKAWVEILDKTNE